MSAIGADENGVRLKRRMEELGLTDYAIRRFALAGNPGDWISRIEEIVQAGANQLWVSPGGGRLERQLHYMRILGKEIMAHFSGVPEPVKIIKQ